MKGYIILFVLFSQFSYAQIWTDTIKWNDFNLQVDGPWFDLGYGLISTNDNKGEKIQYVFWGYGIDIYTYKDSHHGGYIIKIDNVLIDTIDCFANERSIFKSYSNHELPHRNHKIEIIPYPDNKTFVFRKFVKFVDSNPYPPDSIPPLEPCLSDTVYITDTVEIIKWHTIRITDTLYLPGEIIYKLLVPKVEHDTVTLN